MSQKVPLLSCLKPLVHQGHCGVCALVEGAFQNQRKPVRPWSLVGCSRLFPWWSQQSPSSALASRTSCLCSSQTPVSSHSNLLRARQSHTTPPRLPMSPSPQLSSGSPGIALHLWVPPRLGNSVPCRLHDLDALLVCRCGTCRRASWADEYFGVVCLWAPVVVVSWVPRYASGCEPVPGIRPSSPTGSTLLLRTSELHKVSCKLSLFRGRSP